MNREILVSFIIPHKGREELLIKTLDGISKQDFDLNKIEVIIITQNKILNLKPSNYPFLIKILYEDENKTISFLRNRGAQMAQGKFFAFLDADVFISSNWLNVMLKELSDRRCAMVCAPQIVSNNPTFIEKIRVCLNKTKSDKYIDFTGGWNLFLKKEDFFECGGFPENIITCEDYYFCDRINRLGKIYCTSKANFIHLGEDKNFKELFKKEIWRAKGNIKSIKGRRITLKELPSIITPLWIVFFFVLALVGLFMSNIHLLAFSLPLLFIPIFIYSFRLYRLSGNIRFFHAIRFYSVYFVARAIGCLWGMADLVK